jgi:hypothetical protein
MQLTEQQYVAAVLRHFGLTEALRSDRSKEAGHAGNCAPRFNAWPMRPSISAHIAYTFSDRLIAYAWAGD